ncbi:MAG: copper resistance protein NlpE [Prevotella sp.]|jgi:uncharacterized lipoprotein NlpE involved in copper resistance|nr:copper resistance protein NlpE [Prevotella sp.]
MKRFVFIAAVVASLFVIFQACKQKPGQNNVVDTQNVKNSLGWVGFYTGVIPCADCEGIEVSVALNEDDTYIMHYYYIGKENNVEPFKGTFTWDEDGSTVIFSDKTMPHYFKVGENTLTQLDMEGKPIEGEFAGKYILNKMDLDGEHNSKNSLNWEGDYTGEIPCADCPGIKVLITLNRDETYKVKYTYIDRKGAPAIYTGKFSWNNNGSVITLDSKDIPPYYKVGEHSLVQLDIEGKPIEGELADMYVLAKEPQ